MKCMAWGKGKEYFLLGTIKYKMYHAPLWQVAEKCASRVLGCALFKNRKCPAFVFLYCHLQCILLWQWRHSSKLITQDKSTGKVSNVVPSLTSHLIKQFVYGYILSWSQTRCNWVYFYNLPNYLKFVLGCKSKWRVNTVYSNTPERGFAFGIFFSFNVSSLGR